MPSVFAGLESLVSNAIDGLYGETVFVQKMKKGEFSGRSAANTPPFPVVGIIDINPVVTNLQDLAGGDGMAPMLPGESIHVSFDLSLFPEYEVGGGPSGLTLLLTTAEANFAPVKDDFILTERREWPKLSIEFVKPDGIGRIVCVCKKA